MEPPKRISKTHTIPWTNYEEISLKHLDLHSIIHLSKANGSDGDDEQKGIPGVIIPINGPTKIGVFRPDRLGVHGVIILHLQGLTIIPFKTGTWRIIPGFVSVVNNHGDSESSKPGLFPLQMAVSRLINGG